MIAPARRVASLLVGAILMLGGAPAARAVNMLQQFEGLSNADNGSVLGVLPLPPDDNLGVGPSHVFQMVNSVGRIRTKPNSPVMADFSLSGFFNVDAGFFNTDPRVIYDAVSGRWFATILQSSDATSSSSIILAVSATNDPTGTFCRYRLGNPTSETFLQDFPMLGVSDDKVVVAYNGVNFSSEAFIGSGYYVVNKADLLACAGSLRVTRVEPNSAAFTIHPAQSLSSTSDLYMVGANSDGASITVYTVSGVPGVLPVTTTTTVIPINEAPPPLAPQAGSTVLLEPGDGRIESIVWQNHSLWAAAVAACMPPGDSVVRSCLRMGEFRTDTMTGRQDITFGVNGQYYYHPALRLDVFGNLHVVFSSSSSSSFMDVRVTGRLATDALNTLQASTQLRAGGGAQTDSSGRTGDYSGIAVDPSAREKVWVMGEYVASTGAVSWGTFVAQLQFDNPVPSISSLVPASATAFGPTFTLTVNGANFVTGSVVRWNGSNRTTTFVSPTQLTAQIVAPDIMSAGTATVTVLNPAPGGGASGGVLYPIDNPAPSISSVVPDTVNAGGAAFTLAVNGSNFVPSSVVRWNGVARITTFQSTGFLTINVPAADIASGGLVDVSVFTPGPGGGTSGTRTLTINNPAPSISSISPLTAVVGGPPFTLTVNGSGFVPTSIVRWNGSDLASPTFVSSGQLTVTVPAGDIASVGTASVTVFNPAPAGGTSGGATFTVISVNVLSVTVQGSAGGSVTSDPTGIDCGSSCNASFQSGTVVTLTALAGSGATFREWRGACGGTSTMCAVTMSQARSVTAVFSKAFTDPTLAAQSSIIKAAHVLDLRSAIDTLRVQYGLGVYPWTDPTLTAGSTQVKRSHVLDLRSALNEAYQAAGQPLPTYTDATITAGATPVKASHPTDLRDAVRVLE